MIKSVTQLVESIQNDLANWEGSTKPWFRGESGKPIPSRDHSV